MIGRAILEPLLRTAALTERKIEVAVVVEVGQAGDADSRGV